MISTQQEQYTLTQEQINHFRTHGYIKLKGILKPEQLLDFRKQMIETVQLVASNGDKQNRIDDYSNFFTQVTNLWKVQPDCSRFILMQKFGQIARQLLGVPHVKLYHDQALVKGPKTGKTPWHQDYFYWPIDSPKTVTMWMPMHDCPRQMGTMQFVRGSHNMENIIPKQIGSQSEPYYQKIIEQNNLDVDSFDLQTGDATFHSGRTLHCANGNITDKNREVITIIYFQDGARAVSQQQMNEFRRVDLSVFCPGVKVGEIIESKLNPLII